MNAHDKEVYAVIANSMFDQINARSGNSLPKVPVHIGANSMTACAGKCYWRWSPKDGYGHIQPKRGEVRNLWVKIVLSPVWIERGHGADVLTETLGHEMAHLAQLNTRGGADHGPDFEEFCIKLGVNPARCHSLGREAEDGRHVYWCRECGHVSRYTIALGNSDGAVCEPCTRSAGKRIDKVYLGTAEQISKNDLIGTLNQSRSLRVSNWHERVAAQGR